VRIAGILHLADRAVADTDSLVDPIDATTMAGALAFADYQIDHSRAAFEMMEAEPNVVLARKVIAWIRRRELKEFDRRRAYLDCRPHFKAPEDVDPVLQLLIEHDYVKARPQVLRKGAGRTPSPVFDVNPKLLAQNAQNAQNAQSRPLDPNSEDSERGFEPVDDFADPPAPEVSGLDSPPQRPIPRCSPGPRPGHLSVVTTNSETSVLSPGEVSRND
jgi:hypothetical protein